MGIHRGLRILVHFHGHWLFQTDPSTEATHVVFVDSISYLGNKGRVWLRHAHTLCGVVDEVPNLDE